MRGSPARFSTRWSMCSTFSQVPVEDYAEVHVLDLRFFKGDVTEYAKENGITDTLVLYGTQSFVKDTRLRF